MNPSFVRNNVTMVSILLFIFLFGLIQWLKPAFLYNSDGSIREFGIGYKNKTILPVWLLSILLGILCYTAVLFYVNHSRMKF